MGVSGMELRPVDRLNFNDVLKLEVAPDQIELVPPPSVSIARAHIKPDGPDWHYQPLAIYRKDRLVGFLLLVTPKSKSGTAWLSGFLIDRRFQGHRLGRRSLQALHDLLRTEFPNITQLNLTVAANNRAAIALYENTGFVFTGAVHDGELVRSVEFE